MNEQKFLIQEIKCVKMTLKKRHQILISSLNVLKVRKLLTFSLESGTEDFLKHYTQVLEKYVFKIEVKRKSPKWM